MSNVMQKDILTLCSLRLSITVLTTQRFLLLMGICSIERDARSQRLQCAVGSSCVSGTIPLKELKDSNPIKVAEYIIRNGLQEDPVFCWWVHNVLHKQLCVISKLKKHYARMTHKFGVELPHSIQAAFNIDKKTGTDYWFKVIRHELEKLQVVLEIDDTIDPQAIRLGAACSEYVGYKEI